MPLNQPYPTKGAELLMKDGGSFNQKFREVVFGAPKGYTPVNKAAPTPVASPAPPAKAITDYSSGAATERRMKAAGLKDGGELRIGMGGKVPGTGKGDKIAAKYEPGEFVVSNAMLAARPDLRKELRDLRKQVLAAEGKTPEEADAMAMTGKGIRARDGLELLEDLNNPRRGAPTGTSLATIPGSNAQQVPRTSTALSGPVPGTARTGATTNFQFGGTGYDTSKFDAEVRGRTRANPADIRTNAADAFRATQAQPAAGGAPQASGISRAGRMLGGAGAVLGVGLEGKQVYDVAQDPNSTGIDVAAQTATGIGRLGAAGAGAAKGAALGLASPIPGGALLGGIAGGALGYLAADKAIDVGRGMFANDAPAGPTATPQKQQQIGAPMRSTADARKMAGDFDQTRVPSARGTEAVGGVRRIDGGSSPLFTNMPDDGLEGNNNLMNRGPVSAQNQRAFDNIPSFGDQGRAQAQYDREVADAERINAGQALISAASNRGTDITSPEYRAAREQRMAFDQETKGMSARQRTAARQAQTQDMEVRNRAADSLRDDATARRGQDVTSATTRRGQDMDNATRGATDALAQRRQGDDEATNAVTREQAQLGVTQARQLQAAQAEYLNADTDAKRNAAGKKLQALMGKSEQPNRYTVVPGGSQADPQTGAITQNRGMVLDNATGQLVDLDQTGRAQAAPTTTRIPPDAITLLRNKGPSEPALVRNFDAKYGEGAAARYLN